MNLQTRKLSLIEWLASIEDERIINKIEHLQKAKTARQELKALSQKEFHKMIDESEKDIAEGKNLCARGCSKIHQAKKMKLYRIVWTAKAIEQLNDICDYISHDSVKAAEKVTDEILYRVLQLKKFPFSGPEEEQLKKFKKEHRYLVQGNYKIIYRISYPFIFINAVFDTRQNPKKLKQIIRRS